MLYKFKVQTPLCRIAFVNDMLCLHANVGSGNIYSTVYVHIHIDIYNKYTIQMHIFCQLYINMHSSSFPMCWTCLNGHTTCLLVCPGFFLGGSIQSILSFLIHAFVKLLTQMMPLFFVLDIMFNSSQHAHFIFC